MKWKEKNILVVGDVMLDRYIFGNVERISPEAPVPIVSVTKETSTPGGAANAARNVVSLGGNAQLIGIVGADGAKEILLNESRKCGIDVEGIITDSSRPTIQKIRILGHSQQLLRIDYEDTVHSDVDMSVELGKQLSMYDEINAILISDYGKGMITQAVVHHLKAFASLRKIPLLIDPKAEHKSWYTCCTLIKPNRKEIEDMTGIKLNSQVDIERAGLALSSELHCHVLLTLGEDGLGLFEKGKKPVYLPTVAKRVYDVSGAGDTVIATLSLALACGLDLTSAAVLANKAAGIKVGRIGTAPVSLAELTK